MKVNWRQMKVSWRMILGVSVAMLAVLTGGGVRAHPTPEPAKAPFSASPKEFKNATVPLADYPEGQAMMATAAKNAALVDVNVKFLDKDYKDDVYVREPITGKKARVSCLRFRALSGFRTRIDQPQFKLTPQGLTITQNISRISAQGLKVKWMLGPCAWVAGGTGVSMRDVKFVYKARPILSFDGNGSCRLTWNPDTEKLRVSIGDFNVTGVQNDLDKLVKDAFREALNFTLGGGYGSLMGTELRKVTVDICGGGVKVGNR